MKLRIFSVLIFLCVLVSGNVHAVTMSSVQKQEFSRSLSALGFSSVIVTFENPEARQITADDAASERLFIDSNRAAVNRGTASFSPRLKAKMTTTFQYSPSAVMQIDAQDLAELESSSGVAHIAMNGFRRVSLAESVPRVFPTQGSSRYNGDNKWVVAVLDTGVDTSHSFMRTNGVSKVVTEACYSGAGVFDFRVIPLCPGGARSSTASGSGRHCTINSDCDHGTHVAGIAVGDRDNSGIDGVANRGKLMPIQTFTLINDFATCVTSFSCVVTADSDWIRGMERVYQLRNSFDFAAANLSFGGGIYSGGCNSVSPSATNIIQLLRNAGIATTIASGNDGFNFSLSYPACITSGITVGAADDADNEASFSNGNSVLDLFAPGTSIVSSTPGGIFESYNGTSMAAPHVAGAFAVLKQAAPNASISEIEAVLKSVGPNIQLPSQSFSRRRLDVTAALRELVPFNPAAVVPATTLLLDEED
ncbi:MAG: S8 family serine peptidase [Pseudomonadota bacterium]